MKLSIPCFLSFSPKWKALSPPQSSYGLCGCLFSGKLRRQVAKLLLHHAHGAMGCPFQASREPRDGMRRVPVPFPSDSPLGSVPGKAVRTSHRAGRFRGHPALTENGVGGAFYPGRLRAVPKFWGEKCWRWLPARKAARRPYALPRGGRGDEPAPSLPARVSTSTCSARIRAPRSEKEPGEAEVSRVHGPRVAPPWRCPPRAPPPHTNPHCGFFPTFTVNKTR